MQDRRGCSADKTAATWGKISKKNLQLRFWRWSRRFHLDTAGTTSERPEEKETSLLICHVFKSPSIILMQVERADKHLNQSAAALVPNSTPHTATKKNNPASTCQACDWIKHVCVRVCIYWQQCVVPVHTCVCVCVLSPVTSWPSWRITLLSCRIHIRMKTDSFSSRRGSCGRPGRKAVSLLFQH